MSEEFKPKERGQNLLIFAVLIVVLVGLAGLVIDGGFSLSKRREAQNAADAGALAGAAVLCQGGTTTAAEAKAIDYAVNRNNASTAGVNFGNDVITVTTTIPHETFLMKIFGTNVVTTTATASAGCYIPCDLKGVLPVAWACQPPAGVPGVNSCGIDYYDPEDPTHIPWYVVMDSQSLSDDFYCKDPPNNTFQPDLLDCDLNNDGINDVMAGGNRSWLDLSGGGGGAAELRDWIWNGYGGDIRTHTWFGGQAGVENSVFQAVGDIIGTVVWLPVFDSYCEGDPLTVCPGRYHTDLTDPPYTGGHDKIVYSGGTSQVYFHVIQFSAFRITCVVAPGVPHTCLHPGRDLAEGANPTLHWNSIKTIEGYFLEDYGGSGKCEGPDAGLHTIYLNH